MRLANKTTLITGDNSGIGLAAARQQATAHYLEGEIHG